MSTTCRNGQSTASPLPAPSSPQAKPRPFDRLPTAIRAIGRRIPVELRSRVQGIAVVLAARARLWRWRAHMAEAPALASYRLAFLGRGEELYRVGEILGLELAERGAGLPEWFDASTALFSEAPLPGALRVPGQLRTVVPLGRSLDAIVAGYEPELRRRLRHLGARCTTRVVDDPGEVARVNREMLVPFALARHQEHAWVFPEADVQRLAREGRLELVMLDGAPVAAQLGCGVERAAGRVWAALRFGYPEAVFSDPQRLSEANTLNAFRALQYAVTTGHDELDFGTSTACPEGGLLQFKRRRGGMLSTLGCQPFFWLRLPRAPAAFLWRCPLFSVERGGLVLHLGLPLGVADQEVLARLRKLAFGGLLAVRLHADHDVGRELLPAAREVFSSPLGAVHGKGSARHVEIVTHGGARQAPAI